MKQSVKRHKGREEVLQHVSISQGEEGNKGPVRSAIWKGRRGVGEEGTD